MRKITINVSDKDYELALNRNGIKWLEAKGYIYENSSKTPITNYDLLWTVGFLYNYPNMTEEEILKLQDTYKKEKGNPAEVTSFMVNEYLAFINALVDTKSIKNKATITEM